ncbi:MAG: (Fe-S)-binding protein [Acidobacteria bacterium]|nr:(Fe-S)-binding protein [Acidobacteriota bacterium]
MKAGLFVTCLVDQFFPGVAWASVRLLEKAGASVCFDPRQTCCGQPAYNSGFWPEARDVGRSLFDLFPDTDYIVVPSGSCAAMMRRHLFQLHSQAGMERIAAFARRVVELTDFLTRICGRDDFESSFVARAAYHDSCHALRDLQIRDAPRRLLAKVRGLEMVELACADQCCGFGGLFSVKYPEISASMGRDKLRCLRETGAEILVSSDVSCLMHLDGMMRKEGLKIRTLHIAEVLAGSEAS